MGQNRVHVLHIHGLTRRGQPLDPSVRQRTILNGTGSENERLMRRFPRLVADYRKIARTLSAV